MPPTKDRTTIKVRAERAVLAAVRLPSDGHDERDPFGELRALAEQAGAVVGGELEQRRDRPDAGTYIGKGKLDELRHLCDATKATLIVFDHDLSPRQIANIEEATERKVIDRSELILDIFAGRAATHEAKLQVELAQLEYTYPRLRAMWSHLERIVGHGGIGGIGTRGPGEQQLEMDRRIVQRKKVALKRELEQIHDRKRRAVRQRREDHFTLCLVGYTNAGKSTLFNALTAGGAYADDRLFATLMTRTREWGLGGGMSVMLSDTVGFVRDLPHHLVASFRATLEEATHADMLLVVVDVSDPAAQNHYRTVTRTLDELIEEAGHEEQRDRSSTWRPPDRLVLLNKADRLGDNRELLAWRSEMPDAIPICARDPDHPGHEQLRAVVRDAAKGPEIEAELALPMADGRTLNLLENQAEILDRAYENGDVRVRLRIGDRLLARIRSGAQGLRVLSRPPGGGSA